MKTILIVKLNIYSLDGQMNFVQKLINVKFRLFNLFLDGIKFPDSASEKDKALLIMCCIFIDYLWFENF